MKMMKADLPDDLDLLLALDVMLRERHVTRAAQRLGITQGAASQKLARLRSFFDDPLLVPGRPLLVPTPRAELIAAPLSRAIAGLRDAVRAGAPFDPKSSERRFVLLGNEVVEALALPAVLEVLAREAPGVTLSVERAEADFAERLERGTADVAFVPDFLVPGSLRKRSLPPERFVVLLRKDHPIARKKLDLEAYLALGHVLVAPRGLPGSIVDSALEKLGRRRRVVARVQHFLSAPCIVAQSDLVVTCPEMPLFGMAAWLPIASRDLPLDLPADRASLVWHERSDADAGHVWLRRRFDELIHRRKPSAHVRKPHR